MAELTDILVIASDRLLAGEPLPQITADYPDHRDQLEPLLEAASALSMLQVVEMPSPALQAADRREFLAQMEQLESIPVSLGLLARLREWYARYRDNKPMASPYSKKEAQPMTILLAKAALILALAFGALGGSAAAVANSLPDSPIYEAKLALEEIRLALTDDPSRAAELHLNYAINRAQEIQRLAMDGVIADEKLVGQLELHLGQALELAAGLPDQAMQRVLQRTQERTRSQVQALVQIQDQVREQTRLRLREVEQLMVQAQKQARLGQEDPAQFRWQYQHQEAQPETPPQEQYRHGGEAGQHGSGCEDCEPAGDQNQYGPQPDRPGPGEPGGNDDPTCTDCEPAGDQNQYGPQPDQPGPGKPGGNDDATCPDCEPEGDHNQYGPQPDQPGPGEPGGNEDPSCTDCEPEGDENQYGPQPDQPGPGEPGGTEDPPCSDCEPTGDGNQGSDGGEEGDAAGGGTESSGSGGSDDAAGADQGGATDSGAGSSGETGSDGATSGGTDSSGSGDSGSTDQGGSGGRSG